ncbi:MAG: 5-formyltetrahydrofolate cyclo-ligase [Gammaproteobacteria bacterium]|nr:5-formyltetrahydrofolate cyclo-ligase [Gammaproteobacteria bacterium]
MQPAQIRQQYRELRNALGPAEQARNAALLSDNIRRFIGFSRKRKIAAYLAGMGEISLNPWMASGNGVQIYLPMLYEPIEPRLRFGRLDPSTRWKTNRFHIIEPATPWKNTLHARQLDIVLLPLVAFDRQGNRMGMGGGFYDRSLAFRNMRSKWLKPILIGVAHSCQEHPGLPARPWDVILDAVITERETIITHEGNLART